MKKLSECRCGYVLFFDNPRLNCLRCGLPIPLIEELKIKEKEGLIFINDEGESNEGKSKMV